MCADLTQQLPGCLTVNYIVSPCADVLLHAQCLDLMHPRLPQLADRLVHFTLLYIDAVACLSTAFL